MFTKNLRKLKQAGLHRAIIDRGSAQGAKIEFNGRELINFASNDYLGLAAHPEIKNAAKEALEQYGFGAGASRLLAGGTLLHKRLEQKISEFKNTEAALIFNSGYAANTGIIPSITDKEDIIFSDELNHASIIDGCRLSKARTVIYRHKDISHLAGLIKKELPAKGRLIIATDTVFSMDGDIAPLKDIFNLCSDINTSHGTPDAALLYIDDAHGTGVLGKGKGALVHVNIAPEPWIIQMGTFSKALGSYGAFAAGSGELIEWLTNTARSFIFSTALPACAAAAALKAIELLEEMPDLTKRLWENREALVKGLRLKGYSIESETPIVTLSTGGIKETLYTAGHLLDMGIYVPAIRPPAVRTPRLRLTVTAAHNFREIESLLQSLPEAE